jgi:uncharacterized protein
MNPLNFPKWLLKMMVVLYQKLINPILHFFGGPYAGCRYTPSCSNYYLQALDTHGAFKGTLYGVWRICRCHPWGGCGHDPVPFSTKDSKK